MWCYCNVVAFPVVGGYLGVVAVFGVDTDFVEDISVTDVLGVVCIVDI